MFDVTPSGETLVCKLKIPASTDKIVSMAELECKVTIQLGIKSNTPAAKSIKTAFEKRLNQKAKSYLGNFIKDIKRTRAGIGKFVEQHGYDEKNKPSIVKEEESKLIAMWEKFCEKTAPNLAHDAIQEVTKELGDKVDASLKKGKFKAQGKSIASPAIAIAAAAVSLAVGGGVLAGAAAVGKTISAAMKNAERLGAIAQEYGADSSALVKDLDQLTSALKAVIGRMSRLDSVKQRLNTQIASLTAESDRLRQEAKKIDPGRDTSAAGQVERLRSRIEQNGKSIRALQGQILETSELKKCCVDMGVIQKKMLGIAVTEKKGASAAVKLSRDLVDGAKDSLSLIDKLL